MTEFLTVDGGTIAYTVTGKGPLVVLAHGMGDSRHSYRFLAPALAAAGYRVANLDVRGCGDSSHGWMWSEIDAYRKPHRSASRAKRTRSGAGCSSLESA